MTAPLLWAAGVRIVVDERTALTELDLRTQGSHLVVAGDHAALFGALLGPSAPHRGAARIAAGTVQLCGYDVARGDHLRHAGLVPFRVALPGGWTVEEYLHWSARLAGEDRHRASARTDGVFERLGLAAARRRRLKTLGNAERRVLMIAQAILLDPRVLVCEAPLRDLDVEGQTLVEHALAEAASDRATIIGVDHLGPPSPDAELVRQASDLCVLRGGRLLLQRSPHEAYRHLKLAELQVLAQGDALAAELTRRGATVEGGPTHYAVLLPAVMEWTDVLAAAVRVGAPVVHCAPLFTP